MCRSWRDGSCLQRWRLECAAAHMKPVPLLKPFAGHNAHRGCLPERERGNCLMETQQGARSCCQSPASSWITCKTLLLRPSDALQALCPAAPSHSRINQPITLPSTPVLTSSNSRLEARGLSLISSSNSSCKRPKPTQRHQTHSVSLL